MFTRLSRINSNTAVDQNLPRRSRQEGLNLPLKKIYLSLLKPHSLDIFLRSIPFWNSSCGRDIFNIYNKYVLLLWQGPVLDKNALQVRTWVCEHGAEVGADGEKGEALI